MGDVKLPVDYAIDGLSLEAERRAKQLGRPYSYGQLIADTTEDQREEITEKYRRKKLRSPETDKYRRSSDKGGVKRFHKKHASREDEQ